MSKVSEQVQGMNWDYPDPGGIDEDDVKILESFVDEQVKKCGPNIQIADVGCWTGKSTATFALAAPNATINAIDWFKGSDGTSLATVAKDRSIREIFNAHMRYFDIDKKINVMEMTSTEAAHKFADHSLDIVFIDADHRYLHVQEDLNMWFSKVKPGGIFCGHDCEFIVDMQSLSKDFFAPTKDNPWNDTDFIKFHPGVVRAVSERFPKAVIMGKQIWLAHK